MIYSVDSAHFKTLLCDAALQGSSNALAESQSYEADGVMAVLPYEKWLAVLMKTDELKDPNHFTRIRKHAEGLGVLDEDTVDEVLNNPDNERTIIRILLEGIKSSSSNLRELNKDLLNLQDYVGRQPQLIPKLMEDKDAVPRLVEILQDNSRVHQQVGSQYSCPFFYSCLPDHLTTIYHLIYIFYIFSAQRRGF